MKKIYLFIILNILLIAVSVAQNPVVQIAGFPVKSGNVKCYHNIAQAGSRLIVTINHLTPGKDVDLIFRNVSPYGVTIAYSLNQTVDISGRISTVTPSNNNLGIDISNGLSGITGFFEIEVREHNGTLTGTLISNFAYYNHSNSSNTYLVIEKQKQFQIATVPYTFLIHYADNFFINKTIANTYITNIEDAIKDTWDKQVNTWELCKGISKPSALGNIMDMPFDQDGTYHIYVYPYYKIKSVKFYGGDEIVGVIDDGNRAIFIDSESAGLLNATASIASGVITEKQLIYNLIAHEFLHGIQFSHISVSNALNSINPLDEINRRLWLAEGQAKSFETIYMNEHLGASNNNIAYINNCYNGYYGNVIQAFLNDAFGSNYNNGTLLNQSYWFALFWRHLYEYNFDKKDQSIQNKDKLAIWREMCKAYENHNSSNLGTIKTFMTAELQKA